MDRNRRRVFAALAAFAIFFSYGGAAIAEPGPPADPGKPDGTRRLRELRILKLERRLFSMPVQPVPDGESSAGVGTTGSNRCATAGEPGSVLLVDKDISCDSSFDPDNELAIAVHPTDPRILLAGSNDYQLHIKGRTIVQRVPAGYFISLDGGATWIDGEVPMQASFGAGDPAPAFNPKFNRAHMASLSFVCGQGALYCSRGNLAIATLDLSKLPPPGTSFDGSTTPPAVPWQDKMIVNGEAADIAHVQIFSDKEWIVVDTFPQSPHYGNVYMVYARFRSEHGAYDESPIFFTKSEDGGDSWTHPVEISGRNPRYCTFQDDPDDTVTTTGDYNGSGIAETPDDPFACDQDQFAYPAVAPDGTLYVHFHNEQNSAAYEGVQKYDSQIMVVKSTDGGDTFFGEQPTAANQTDCVRQPLAAAGTPTVAFPNPCIVPIHVVDLEDSYDEAQEDGPQNFTADYPLNVQGRTTLTNMQFRVNSAGTIAIAPAVGGCATTTCGASDYRVVVVFADNCAGVRPLATTPPNPPFTGSATPPITDTNLYYAYSDDGGNTWVGGDVNNGCGAGAAGSGRLVANAATAAGDDQWFPWIAAHPTTGALAAVTMDGAQFDGNVRHTYGVTLWTSGPTVLGAPPVFGGPIALAGAPSDPHDARFFRAVTPDPAVPDLPGCEYPVDNPATPCPVTFIGDYNGVVVGIDGVIHAVWTDMRRPAVEEGQNDPVTGRPGGTRKTEDAYYAQRPTPTP